MNYKTQYPMWKKSMKKSYTILAPEMLPYHFELFEKVLKSEGYNIVILKNNSRTVIDDGLLHVHNDTCYPCLCVVGQYIDALKSGKYDLSKTALLITQTGGGCRASNYLSLVRKAIGAQYPKVPVLSLNFSGLEKHSSLPMSIGLLKKLAFAILYGDVIMWCYNQTKPYETEEGSSDRVLSETINYVGRFFESGKYKQYETITEYIIQKFSQLWPMGDFARHKTRVGIVGEIYIKYSALGNNNLNKMLLSEDCEPIVPTLMDFVMYTILGKVNDSRMYGVHKIQGLVYKRVYNWLYKMEEVVRGKLLKYKFEPMHDMNHLRDKADKVINQGVKMGEGWLIPAEMAELYESGVKNIVCAQPFGCLPNHIVGKGTIRTLRQMYPDINIVAIDYDPSASTVNQENRIKLMLAGAQQQF